MCSDTNTGSMGNKSTMGKVMEKASDMLSSSKSTEQSHEKHEGGGCECDESGY